MAIIVNIFEGCGRKKRRRVRIVPRLGIAVEQTRPVLKTPQYQGSVKGETIMAFELPATHQVNVAVEFRDRKNNPAPVDDVPVWSVDNSELLLLTPAADGMSCLVAAVGPLGTANVTLQADADLGDGSTPVIGTLEVQITGGTATVVALTPGTPEEQPL